MFWRFKFLSHESYTRFNHSRVRQNSRFEVEIFITNYNSKKQNLIERRTRLKKNVGIKTRQGP